MLACTLREDHYGVLTEALIIDKTQNLSYSVKNPDIATAVRFGTTAMTVLVAVCIVLTIRLVGVMLLMSMLSLPMMVAEIFCHRMGPLMATSAIVSLLTCLGGLFISSMMDIPCSAVIVILMATIFILAKTAKTFIALINNTRTSS